MNDRWILGLLVTSLATSCASFAQADTLIIAGTNTGAIPDNSATGRVVSFNVSSTQRVGSVGVQLGLTHTWVGDLEATLRSPNGDAQLVLFSRIGVRESLGTGDSSDLAGNYAFFDALASSPGHGDIWAAATTADATTAIPEGIYRTSTAGYGSSNHGGCSTRLDAAFGSAVPRSQSMLASGVWTLTITDRFAGDIGSVTAASLIIQEAETIFTNGFDSPPTIQVLSNCIKTTHDLTGNGLADFTTLVDNAGELEWTVREHRGGSLTSAFSTFNFGASATDVWNSADIDGDGIDDPVIFTPATGVFQVRRSSRPGSTPLQVGFGPPAASESRNSLMLGDYDGDGLDDFAVERQRSAAPFGPSRLEYIRSSDGALVFITAGDTIGGRLRSAGGEDVDGDGKADLIQRGQNNTNYTIYRGTDGIATGIYSFGTPTAAVLLAGNRAGDTRADVTEVRVVGTDIVWETQITGPGTTSTPLAFGAIGVPGLAAFTAAADYDGDGLLDYSHWQRNNAGTGPSQFFVMPTSSPGTTWTVDQGGPGAIPLAGTRAF